MMKATAFAPGHISGFFEPVYEQDMARTGSRGAGLSISLGAISEVIAEPSTKQDFYVFINNKKSNVPVMKLALRYLIGDNPIKVIVKTKYDLPFGQGFGMSAACALSATYALSKTVNKSISDAMKAAHFAEVQLKTGLGDVMGSSFGGIEIRKSPGLPPWGIIEHIPGKCELVLCIIGKKLDTKKILEDPQKTTKVVDYGKYCTKKILERPSIENLFSLSQIFTKKTGLAENRVLDAINSANKFGIASMCMLGNSVFAFGKTNELSNELASFGKVIVCSVDENGARILEG
jgi:pantoate kinase